MNYGRRSDDKANGTFEPADGFVPYVMPHSVYLAITARFGTTVGARMVYMRVK